MLEPDLSLVMSQQSELIQDCSVAVRLCQVVFLTLRLFWHIPRLLLIPPSSVARLVWLKDFLLVLTYFLKLLWRKVSQRRGCCFLDLRYRLNLLRYPLNILVFFKFNHCFFCRLLKGLLLFRVNYNVIFFLSATLSTFLSSVNYHRRFCLSPWIFPFCFSTRFPLRFSFTNNNCLWHSQTRSDNLGLLVYLLGISRLLITVFEQVPDRVNLVQQCHVIEWWYRIKICFHLLGTWDYDIELLRNVLTGCLKGEKHVFHYSNCKNGSQDKFC